MNGRDLTSYFIQLEPPHVESLDDQFLLKCINLKKKITKLKMKRNITRKRREKEKIIPHQ